MDPTESAAYSYLGACYNCMNDNKRAIKYFHIANEYDNVATIYLIFEEEKFIYII